MHQNIETGKRNCNLNPQIFYIKGIRFILNLLSYGSFGKSNKKKPTKSSPVFH